MKRTRTILKGFVLLLLVFSFTGCDALEGINPFNNEKEVSGIVEAIGDNALTVDGIEYTVTANTEYEGISGLVGIPFVHQTRRRAVEASFSCARLGSPLLYRRTRRPLVPVLRKRF